MKAAGRLTVLLLAGLLAACGGGGDAPRPIAARPYDDPGFVRAGDFEMRYGTMLASELNPDVAKAYAILRSDSRAVLSVSVLRQSAGSLPVPIEAETRGFRRRLTGERVPLDFRRIDEQEGPSYVAEFDVGNAGPVVLEFVSVPAGSASRLEARVVREFGSD